MSDYTILMPPAGDAYCAIYNAPEMRNFARPSRGKSMGDTYTPVDFKMTHKVRGTQVPDVIRNVLAYLMVSPAMRELLETNVTLPIEYLPFRLLHHKGRVAAENCAMVNVLDTVDCADTAGIEGTPHPSKPGLFFSVKRLPIVAAKVPADRNIFRVSAYPALVFVRDDLRKTLEAAGMKASYLRPGDPV